LPGVQGLAVPQSPQKQQQQLQPPDYICSFLVGLNHQENPEGLARVNVFCDTGTVATCRIFHGIPRETFRRNVSSLDVVERLLRHPPCPAEVDESLVGLSDATNTNNLNASTGSVTMSPTKKKAPPPIRSLKDDIELVEVGLCILNGEKEKLQNHLLSLEEEKREEANVRNNSNAVGQPKTSTSRAEHNANNQDSTEEGEEDEGSEEEGMEFQFSLPVSAMKHVEQCLQDISRMNKLVRGVATNGKGTIFLYGNGGVAYTPNIPKHLYQKLKLLRNSPISARPSYVSLGTRDRYFVAFKDDTFDWKGPKPLDKILKGISQAPRSVAFGSSYDTFFIVFADGSWKFHGRSIPPQLADKLEERRDKADLVCVNLGPHGEWFLRAENGRMWWGGISEDLDAVTQEILQAGNFLHFIDFGEDGSYFLSHDS